MRVCDHKRDPSYHGPKMFDSKGRDVTPSISYNCREEARSGYWKLLLIPVSIGIGLGVGKYTYMAALANANRKGAAGLAGAYMAKSIWNM